MEHYTTRSRHDAACSIHVKEFCMHQAQTHRNRKKRTRESGMRGAFKPSAVNPRAEAPITFLVNVSRKKTQWQIEVHLTGPRGTANRIASARCRAQKGTTDSSPCLSRHAQGRRGRARTRGAEFAEDIPATSIGLKASCVWSPAGSYPLPRHFRVKCFPFPKVRYVLVPCRVIFQPS